MKSGLINVLEAASEAFEQHRMGGHHNCSSCRENDADAAFDYRQSAANLRSGNWTRDDVELAVEAKAWVTK